MKEEVECVLDSTALDHKGIANIAFRDVIPHVGSESLCPRTRKVDIAVRSSITVC